MWAELSIIRDNTIALDSIPRPPLRRAARWLLILALFAAGIVQGFHFGPGERAITADDQLYFYVSERVASGVPPHVSMVDHKNQLAELISGAAIAAGRLVGADDVLAARVPSIVLAAAVVPLIAVLTETLTGSMVAGLLSAACALTFRGFFMEAATGFRPQLFMMFFAVAALTAYARGRAALAGALAAGATLSWQPAALIAISLLVAAAFEPRPARTLVRITAGGVLAVCCYEAYFWLEGALGEQLYQSYVLATIGKSLEAPGFINTVKFIVYGDAGEMGVRSVSLFAAMMLTGLALLAVWLLVRPHQAVAAWRARSAWRAVLVAACGTIGFTFLDHQAYPDRFFVLPFVALAAGAVPAILLGWMGTLPMLLVCVALGAWTLSYAWTLAPGIGGFRLKDQRAMARDVGKVVDLAGGGVWAVARPDLLALERRENWNAFSMLFDERVLAYGLRSSGSATEYRPVRHGMMPQVLVIARVSTNTMMWIRREYTLIPLPRFSSSHVRVYLRKSKLRDDTVLAKQCGDPTGERFPIIGLGLGRPPLAQDALHLLNSVLKKRPCQACVCDVDGSGAVTAGDALWLLEFVAGEHEELRCPPCKPGPNQRLFEQRTQQTLKQAHPGPRRMQQSSAKPRGRPGTEETLREPQSGQGTQNKAVQPPPRNTTRSERAVRESRSQP